MPDGQPSPYRNDPAASPPNTYIEIVLTEDGGGERRVRHVVTFKPDDPALSLHFELAMRGIPLWRALAIVAHEQGTRLDG